MNLHPPLVLFGPVLRSTACRAMPCMAGARLKGRPVSVIAISTDEPDERGLALTARLARLVLY